MFVTRRKRLFRVAATITVTLWLAISGSATATAQGDRVKLGQYVAPDFFFAIIYHPVLFEDSILAPHADLDQLEPLLEKVEGVEKEDVRRIIEILQPEKIFRVIVLADPLFDDTADPVRPAFIVQYRDKIDGKEMLNQLFQGVEAGEHAGKTYYKSTHEKLAEKQLSGHVAGPRTIIIAGESSLHKMLTESDDPRPLVEQMRKVNLKHDVIIHFLSEPLFAVAKRQGVSPEDLIPKAGDNEAAQDMAKNIRSLYITLDSTGETLSTIGIQASDENAAQEIHAKATDGLSQAKVMYQQFGPQLQLFLPPTLVEPLNDTLTALLDGTKIEHSGSEITTTIPLPESLPALAKEAAKFAEEFAAGGGFPGGIPGGGVPGGGPGGDDGFPGDLPPEEDGSPQDDDAIPEEDSKAVPF